MNLAESLSKLACPPRFGSIPSPVPTGERSVPKGCDSLQWQIPNCFRGLTMDGMQIHSTTEQLANAFHNEAPRLQAPVQPRFRAGPGPRRAIPLQLTGKSATIVSSVLVFGVHLRRAI